MAEKILWIAKCKLRGMNQRVGVVYDDQTGQIQSLRAVGPGVGTLRVDISHPLIRNKLVFTRLAHKADRFDLVDLNSVRLNMVPSDRKGGFSIPDDIDFTIAWNR